MLVAVWIITFLLIIGIGVYAGTKIKSTKSMVGRRQDDGSHFSGLYICGVADYGSMAVVGAAQKLAIIWNFRRLVFNCRVVPNFIALAVFAKIIRGRECQESVPAYLQNRFDTKTTRPVFLCLDCLWISFIFRFSLRR